MPRNNNWDENDDFVTETCDRIDRDIEQMDNDLANHQATLKAIEEGRKYQENSNYDPSTYVDGY